MKKLLVLLLCLPMIGFGQSIDEQIVIEYSLNYKAPSQDGAIGVMKKIERMILPNLCVMYFAPNLCRIELDHTDISVFGKGDKEALIIKSYIKSELFVRNKGKFILANYLTDLIKNTNNLIKRTYRYDIYVLFMDTTTSLTYQNDKKKIKLNIRGNELIKEAVKFNYENKTEKGTGYILKDISAIGALVDGQDYGLPISYAIYNKKSNITAIYECIGFRIEDIDHNLYKSSIWKY